MRYQLQRDQQLNCDIELAWSFFSSPYNLAHITPKEMNFQVLNEIESETIYKGMEIHYRISPLLKIPLKWETKITEVNYQESFTDYQIKGPYKYWNHYHEFLPNVNGVLMKDRLDYELPFGFVGKMAHRIFVRKKLEHIFNYRHQILESLFNSNQKDKYNEHTHSY